MLQIIAREPLGRKTEYNALCSEWSSYFADIFRDARTADGAVCIFSDKKDQKNISFVRASQMFLRAPRELARHDVKDTFFTFATFRESKEMKRSYQNIDNIFAWSVDIDYMRTELAPLDVLQFILDTVSIPLPNYVEYGHRLRLIYLLEEPLRLLTPTSKKSLLNGFSFMQKCIATLINEEISWANAESCSAVSFFRVPGSINTKSGDVIKLCHLTDERWTMQEIFNEWIPDRLIDKSKTAACWKEVWKKKKHKNKRKWNGYRLWERRMERFEELRQRENIPREKLVFLYGVGCLQTHRTNSSAETVEQLLRFNMGFPIPLEEKEIRSKFRTIRAYAFKEETIAAFLGVETEILFDRKIYDLERYRKKRQTQIKKHSTKQQKIECRREIVRQYHGTYTLAEIADRIKVSVSTVKRDLAFIKQTKEPLVKEPSIFTASFEPYITQIPHTAKQTINVSQQILELLYSRADVFSDEKIMLNGKNIVSMENRNVMLEKRTLMLRRFKQERVGRWHTGLFGKEKRCNEEWRGKAPYFIKPPHKIDFTYKWKKMSHCLSYSPPVLGRLKNFHCPDSDILHFLPPSQSFCKKKYKFIS